MWGKAEGGVFGGVLLEVGRLVGFVDDDQTEISDWGEEGGARAYDDERFVGVEDFFEEEVAGGGGLFGVEEDYAVEVLLEFGD